MKVFTKAMSKLLATLYRHANAEDRSIFEKEGIHIIPANFYSSIPSIEEIENSFEYSCVDPPYRLKSVFNNATITKTLRMLLKYAHEFTPPRDGDKNQCSRFFWNNPMFSYCDAMSYYCFIRLLKPKTILEIGSGFSTLVALDAVNMNGFGLVNCIEPYPRPFLEDLEDKKKLRLYKKRAQEVDKTFFNTMLSDGDILFVDSTHAVKAGSDCLHIYLRILPFIKKNIYIQVHDIFLPFGMPKQWLLERQIFWTEQYLLLAFLIDNLKASVLFGSTYCNEYNKELLQKLMGGKYGTGGGSLWFQYRGGTRG
jgi:hypothetical protein